MFHRWLALLQLMMSFAVLYGPKGPSVLSHSCASSPAQQKQHPCPCIMYHFPSRSNSPPPSPGALMRGEDAGQLIFG